MCAFQGSIRDFLPPQMSQIKAGQSICRSGGRCDLTEAGMKELLKHSTLARHPSKPADLRTTGIHYRRTHTLHCTDTLECSPTHTQNTLVCLNVPTFSLMHILCVGPCMLVVCTHIVNSMCAILICGGVHGKFPR